MDKFSVISIGKKTTGSLYIKGKTHHTTVCDFILSIFFYIIIIFTVSNLTARMGLITENKISLIPNYESFTSKKLSSLGQSLSNSKNTSYMNYVNVAIPGADDGAGLFPL